MLHVLPTSTLAEKERVEMREMRLLLRGREAQSPRGGNYAPRVQLRNIRHLRAGVGIRKSGGDAAGGEPFRKEPKPMGRDTEGNGFKRHADGLNRGSDASGAEFYLLAPEPVGARIAPVLGGTLGWQQAESTRTAR